MKKQLLYIAACCFALLPVACDKEDTDAVRYGFGEGGIVMTVAAPSTRAINDADLTLAKCTVDIYQRTTGEASSETAETWIRHYEPGDCPETVVKLLAGDYFVSVKWGEQPADAALDKCFYKGCADFTVTAGQTQSVAVSCTSQCAVVAVGFDKSIAEKKLSDVRVEVSLPTSEAALNSLTFTTNDTGYFNMPEDGAELTWSFHAVHPEKGAVEKTGTVKKVLNGKKYALNFRYSDDLPGYVDFDLSIDERPVENRNDMLIFSPMPVVEGALFDAEVVDFADEPMTLTMKTIGDATVRDVKLYQVGATVATRSGYSTRADFDVDSDLLLWHWHCPEEGGEPTVTGETNITANLLGEGKLLEITLNPAFFSFPIGATKLRFEIHDSKEAFAENTAVIRVNEGIRPVVESDYDLWTNIVTLRAVSTKGVPPTFKLRLQGKEEWETVTGISAGENEYTATFTPDWVKSKNAKDLDIYTPAENTGVWAGHTYEACAEIGDRIAFTSFSTGGGDTIPNGDMEDTNASCYGTNNSNASTVIWGSGNNSYTTKSPLCSAAEMKGMGGANCSKLTASAPAGNLAAGNLFLGTFTMNVAMGTVDFGIPYVYTARPKGLRFKYYATVDKVDYNKYNGPLDKGEQDMMSIYFTIMDWSKRKSVTSGMGTPSGMWSADAQSNVDGCGAIIGYGILYITASTAGDSMIEGYIPAEFYDTAVAAPTGSYTLTIACSTSAYGDYMNGCSTNVLYVDDFEWVY